MIQDIRASLRAPQLILEDQSRVRAINEAFYSNYA